MSSKQNSKIRTQNRGRACVIALILIFVIIGVGVYFYIKSRKENVKITETMKAAPQETAALVFLDAAKIEDESLRNKFTEEIFRHKDKGDSPLFPGAKKRFSFNAKKESPVFIMGEDVNYKEDIMPWWGLELTMGTTDMADRKKDSSRLNGFIVFKVKDRKKAEKALERLAQKKGYEKKEEKLVKQKVGVYTHKDTKKVLYCLLDKKRMIFSDSQEEMERVIQAARRKAPGISTNKEFKDVTKRLEGPAILLVYLDLTKVGDSDKKLIKNEKLKKAAEIFRATGLTMSLKDENYIISGFTLADTSGKDPRVQKFFAEDTSIGKLDSMKLFSSDTSMYVAFNSNIIYKLVKAVAESEKENIGQLFKDELGIDLDSDIKGNLAGDIAIKVDLMKVVQSALKMFLGFTLETTKKVTEAMGVKVPGMSMIKEPEDKFVPVTAVISFNDKGKLRKLFEKLTLRFKNEGQVIDYQKSKIFTFKKDKSAIALYENFLIYSFDPRIRDIKKIIENKMDDKNSIKKLRGYQMIKDQVGKDTLMVAMMDMKDLIPTIEDVAKMQSMNPLKKDNSSGMKDAADVLKQYHEYWAYVNKEIDGVSYKILILKDKSAQK